jgi:hypothetical protein
MKSFKQILKEGFLDIPSTKELDKKEKLHKNLTNHYKTENFNRNETEAIENYTDNSQPINRYHWNKHKGIERHKDSENKNKEITEHLDSALDKHKTPEDMTVYSGTIHDPRKLKNSKGIVHHPAFISSTIKKHVADKFATGNQQLDDDGYTNHRHILSINVPKGHSGVYVDHMSSNKDEKEFILPRGTNLKHLHTDSEEKNEFDVVRHIHHMEIV